MARLTLTDIKKSFGETQVLKGISLDVQDGEFLSLVGASGCGKSTLLRIISGLETADSGRIEIDGVAVDQATPKARNVALVFQDYALYPHMSVAQNMAMPLVMGRLPMRARLPGAKWVTPGHAQTRREIAAKVQQVAEQLRIAHLLDRRPAALSGGQRQRVALGRALVRDPSLFLMDEPLSNLDAKLRVEVRREIVELHRKSGLTFVYVTHDQVEAMTMSDRVALLQEGHLLQVGPPGALYGDPASIDVARFIGSPEVNLLPVRAVAGGLQLAGQALPVASGQPEGTDLMLGIRPEAIRLAGSGTGPSFGLQVVRHGVEDLGGELVVHGALAHAPDVALRLRVQKAPDASAPLHLPETFAAEVPVGAVLLFGAGGQRLAVGQGASLRTEVPA
ncbi:ABC transporter ATP-binding protein [Pseudooceanicola nanhaiensis]|uniref:ABC transporter ATP-binding protein n=1 Tax=Pseudooceanicola nanhaiensis TaxID=375761 RepID=UPI001CD6C9A6|nr:ABC transporter ATP-binding protein [Pseudooceanicola nanhaiensis]MCA0922648.1 ABC transporter ATP-binding protein [Pseudooceanicola nanhaiensis]